EVSSSSEARPALPTKRRRILLALLSAAGVLALGAAGWGLVRNFSRQPPSPILRRLTYRSGVIHNARFAPDGQTIVYGATWQAEPRPLYQMRLGSPESRPFDFAADDILAISSSGEMAMLVGGDGFSGVLARVSMAGGTPREVLEGVPYAGADWGPGGKDLVVAHPVGDVSR